MAQAMTFTELTVLIPCHGLEDFPTELAEKPAASLLNAFAVIWHPALIASSGAMPRWRRADDPPPAAEGSLVIIPTASDDMMPGGWITQARLAGAIVISEEHDRTEMMKRAVAPLKLEAPVDPDLVADFMALGSCYLQLELLTRRMRNYSNFDELRMHVEAVAAAKAAVSNDREAAKKHLTNCFEMLLESRERFYPVELYLLDLCLINAETWPKDSTAILGLNTAQNLLGTADDWEKIVSDRPEIRESLQQAVQQKRVELLGGDDTELYTSLQSLDAVLWHLRQGRSKLEEITGSKPEVWARRRFGMSSQMPQILHRLGYHGALHTLLDDGVTPEDEQSQLRWEGCDGSSVDSFSRIPLPGDSARTMLRLSERMAESMDYDHVAAVMFAHWPALKSPFFADLRRIHTYAPVLGQFVRLSDYFTQTGSPGRRADFKSGEYLSPALNSRVAHGEATPISGQVQSWTRERAFRRAEVITALAKIIRGDFNWLADNSLESAVRQAYPGASAEACNNADTAIAEALRNGSAQLNDALASGCEDGPGVLIVNTHSFPRKVLINWPGKGGPPQDRSILGVQVDEDQIQVLVSLPPCGFVWLANRNERPGRTPAGKPLLAEELLLRNDNFEVRFSDTTGGISQIMTYHRTPNRLSQQVAIRFPHPKAISFGEGDKQETITTNYTAMRLKESRVLKQGPLVGEIATLGELVDEQTETVLATFRQWTRVIKGKSTIEVDLEIAPAVPIKGDPWTNYLGCRFAWKHEMVALSASMQEGAQSIRRERIEAPQFIEIADDDFRTTIITPGLTFHRKTGERMLDTLLLTEGEESRLFQFAVAIDNPYPMQAHLDQYSPPVVIETKQRPVDGKREGWFFHVSASNVQLQRFLPGTKPNSIIVRLLETEGRSRVIGLHCFRNPISARQVDFKGSTITTMNTDDAVSVEIGPYEICDVELEF
ncbi:hypothetical protein [Planctomicrobium sp. SH527]|uniref:glycoside hydrolase family 38 N-terminal domain-containing protein n=1 Tax=Planctomicrobium sp. SH527 TaxID=3448123 RepID=UPI003F5C3D37